jgi:hypothetical protein
LFKKKSQQLRGFSGAYETKSNNIAILREETQQSLHAMVVQFDQLHQLLIQTRSAFTVKTDVPEPKSHTLNIQISAQNTALSHGQKLMRKFNSTLKEAQ